MHPPGGRAPQPFEQAGRRQVPDHDMAAVRAHLDGRTPDGERPIRGVRMDVAQVPDAAWRRLIAAGHLDGVTRLVVGTASVSSETLAAALRLPSLRSVRLTWRRDVPADLPPSLGSITDLDLLGCTASLCEALTERCPALDTLSLTNPTGRLERLWSMLGGRALRGLALSGLDATPEQMERCLGGSVASLARLSLHATTRLRTLDWLASRDWSALAQLSVTGARLDRLGTPKTPALTHLDLRGTSVERFDLEAPEGLRGLDLRGVPLSGEVARFIERAPSRWTRLGLSASARAARVLAWLACAGRVEVLDLASGDAGERFEFALPDGGSLAALRSLSASLAWSVDGSLVERLLDGSAAPALTALALTRERPGEFDLRGGWSPTLRALTLTGHAGRLLVAEEAPAPALQSLTLEKARLDASFPAWLSACVDLRRLDLQRVDLDEPARLGDALRAVAPRVEHLRIAGLDGGDEAEREVNGEAFAVDGFPRLGVLELDDVALDEASFRRLIHRETVPRLARLSFEPGGPDAWHAVAEEASFSVVDIQGPSDDGVDAPLALVHSDCSRVRYARVRFH